MRTNEPTPHPEPMPSPLVIEVANTLLSGDPEKIGILRHTLLSRQHELTAHIEQAQAQGQEAQTKLERAVTEAVTLASNRADSADRVRGERQVEEARALVIESTTRVKALARESRVLSGPIGALSEKFERLTASVAEQQIADAMAQARAQLATLIQSVWANLAAIERRVAQARETARQWNSTAQVWKLSEAFTLTGGAAVNQALTALTITGQGKGTALPTVKVRLNVSWQDAHKGDVVLVSVQEARELTAIDRNLKMPLATYAETQED